MLSPTESATLFSRIPPLLSIVLLENVFPLSQVSNKLSSPISLQIGNNNFNISVAYPLCLSPGRNQEYVPYITSSKNRAFDIWQGIFRRCNKKSSRKCYDNSVICDSWARDPESFLEWYWANNYECEGESMAVDKDLLYPGNKVYAPDKCCILPQTLNTMLSNSKKHYFSRRVRRN